MSIKNKKYTMSTAQFISATEIPSGDVSSVFLEELYLSSLIKRFPQYSRMAKLAAKFLSNAPDGKQFTAAELFDYIVPPSLTVFAELITCLCGIDLLKRIVRLNVENFGIADYSSVTDVPDEVFDPVEQKMVTIMPSHVSVLYQVSLNND